MKWQKLLLDARENPDQVPGTTDPSSKHEQRNNNLSAETSVYVDGTDIEAGTNISEELKAEHRDELAAILVRVEKCLELVHTDRVKCKSELKNLRYYLKALMVRNK